MDSEEIVRRRVELLDAAVGHIRRQEGICGIFLAGSIAAGRDDEWSDIDLRVIVLPEQYDSVLSSYRLHAPREWGDLRFNVIHPGSIHSVSHYRPFFKADVFYYRSDKFVPSPWLTLPTKVLFDPDGLIERVIKESNKLTFQPSGEDLERSIHFGISTVHEVYRRARRGELIYAEDLLASLRRSIVEADCCLRLRPFENVESCADPAVRETLRNSCVGADQAAILAALRELAGMYGHLITRLHEKHHLPAPLELYRESLRIVEEELIPHV